MRVLQAWKGFTNSLFNLPVTNAPFSCTSDILGMLCKMLKRRILKDMHVSNIYDSFLYILPCIKIKSLCVCWCCEGKRRTRHKGAVIKLFRLSNSKSHAESFLLLSLMTHHVLLSLTCTETRDNMLRWSCCSSGALFFFFLTPHLFLSSDSDSDCHHVRNLYLGFIMFSRNRIIKRFNGDSHWQFGNSMIIILSFSCFLEHLRNTSIANVKCNVNGPSRFSGSTSGCTLLKHESLAILILLWYFQNFTSRSSDFH